VLPLPLNRVQGPSSEAAKEISKLLVPLPLLLLPALACLLLPPPDNDAVLPVPAWVLPV
jgi:hypothetical protein